MTAPRIVLIGAVARNGVIGREGAMPWHLPEDFAHFRKTTMGHPVIMGRRTWDSLPPRFRPLPGRTNIVVTRQPQWQAEGAVRCGSMAEAIAAAKPADKAFVIGGAELYSQALLVADELVLTEIDADFEGDTRFPRFEGAFVPVSREEHQAAEPNDFRFAFVTYQRRPG